MVTLEDAGAEDEIAREVVRVQCPQRGDRRPSDRSLLVLLVAALARETHRVVRERHTRRVELDCGSRGGEAGTGEGRVRVLVQQRLAILPGIKPVRLLQLVRLFR